MKQIYDSLKGLFNNEIVQKTAKTVDEAPEKVTDATNSVIAGLLAMMLKKGATPQMREIFEEAGNLDILSDIDNICREKLTKNQLRIGDNFLQHLLGDNAAKFTDVIADSAGISNVATNRIIAMVAPIIAGFFGNRMVKDNWSLHTVLTEIEGQKNRFRDDIPKKVIDEFGLNSLLAGNTKSNAATAPVKKSRGWIFWLILILLAILCFILFRTCKKDKYVNMYSEETTITEQPVVINRMDTLSMSDRMDLTLPDGTIIKVKRNGVEARMVDFLKSDKYKNATENDLKSQWFEFDDINFDFNSATELEHGSLQLDNIAAILKSFDNVKIKVAANADRVGSDEASMRISEGRAKTIASLLKSRGVGSQIVDTEGQGNEYADLPASASEEARAKDRDIALRFVK